jgi:hypothetical protein
MFAGTGGRAPARPSTPMSSGGILGPLQRQGDAIRLGWGIVAVLAATSANADDSSRSAASDLSLSAPVSINEAVAYVRGHLRVLRDTLQLDLDIYLSDRIDAAIARHGLDDSQRAVLRHGGAWGVDPAEAGVALRIAEDFYGKNATALQQTLDVLTGPDAPALVSRGDLLAIEEQLGRFYGAEPAIQAMIDDGFVLAGELAATRAELIEVRGELDLIDLGSDLGLLDGEMFSVVAVGPAPDLPADPELGPLTARESELETAIFDLNRQADALFEQYAALRTQYTSPLGMTPVAAPFAPEPAPSGIGDTLRE